MWHLSLIPALRRQTQISVSSRPTSCTEQVPGQPNLPSETVSQKKMKTNSQLNENEVSSYLFCYCDKNQPKRKASYCWLSMACSACFLLQRRTTYPGMAPLPWSRPFPCEPLIKKNAPQTWPQESLIEAIPQVQFLLHTLYVSPWPKPASTWRRQSADRHYHIPQIEALKQEVSILATSLLSFFLKKKRQWILKGRK